MRDLPLYQSAPEPHHRWWPLPGFDESIEDRARRAARHLPHGSVVVGRTAAWLHGVEILPAVVKEKQWPVEVSIPKNRRPLNRPQVREYRWRISPGDIITIDGISVTTPERTLVDCARTLPRLDAVAAVDQLLPRVTNTTRLAELIGIFGRVKHAVRMRQVLEASDSRAASVMESWCRCMIIDADLPRPTSQVPVHLADGTTAHLDLGYTEYRLGLEYDGRDHHTSPADVAHDRWRRSAIAVAGWRVEVFNAHWVLNTPDQMLWRVLRRLRQAGWRPDADRVRRIEKRIDYIAMCRRLDRQAWTDAYGW